LATIIVLTNQKGGVGKTTTSTALAAGLVSFYNKKVLAIDLDPQGNMGFSLGLDIEEGRTIHDVMIGRTSAREAIQTTDYCDVITSNILLSSAELEFNFSDRELLLKNSLAPVADDYDFIIIDTPPALNIRRGRQPQSFPWSSPASAKSIPGSYRLLHTFQKLPCPVFFYRYTSQGTSQ